MGWDAFAVLKSGVGVAREWNNGRGEPYLKSTRLRAAFEDAAHSVRARGLTVDWMLPIAGLDVSTCGQALEEIAGRSVYDEDGWNPEFVQRAWKSAADLEGPTEGEDAWAWWCAFHFLKACAQTGLGVTFSW